MTSKPSYHPSNRDELIEAAWALLYPDLDAVCRHARCTPAEAVATMARMERLNNEPSQVGHR